MKLTFPDNFIFGTSTAAAQIETAFEHDWQGFKARNGAIFDTYEGTVTFYLAEPDDPIIRTLGQVFPALLRPLAEMPEGLRSLAFRIAYRSDERTLTDEEVAGMHERVRGLLEQHFAAQLR